MKKLATLLCAVAVVAVASLASAQTADTKKPADAAKPAAAAEKTHVVEAEVVSTDATAKTITIKGDPNKTVAVDSAAVGSLKDLKSGDKVKLTCRDNEKGEHVAVTKIAKDTK
jgi:FtsP/CotA-like multicopper oxidase with cupredoxin domain